MATVTTPYSGARKLINSSDVPNWMNDYDAQRVASYKLYEDIYWTNPTTFKLIQRGAEENPIYIPSGRIIVNTMDRYTAPDWVPVMDPAYGTPNDQAAALIAFTDLFKREKMGTQYVANKLYGIMRGDWCWHITANPNKPQGMRIKIKAIDPATYFPINDEDDVDRILGVDLIEQTVFNDKTSIRRTRYLKPSHEDNPFGDPETEQGPISYQVDVLELENWEDPVKQKIQITEVPPVPLPPQITALPVYHVKNFEEPQNPFGSSEMRGLERIMAAVNQSITDEELALAMGGLGMYKTGGVQPIDAQGNPTTWRLGPGQVVHDDTFDRVGGVQAGVIEGSQSHIKYLHDQMDLVTGASDVAKGVVSVEAAESGIALTLRMGPILNVAKRKDVSIRETQDQLLFDLRSWFAAYEGLNMEAVRLNSQFGEKLPEDKQQRFEDLLKMVSNDPPLITMGYFRDACRELGYKIPIDVNGQAIADEQVQFADAAGTRLDAEIADAEQQELDAGGEE